MIFLYNQDTKTYWDSSSLVIGLWGPIICTGSPEDDQTQYNKTYMSTQTSNTSIQGVNLFNTVLKKKKEG